MIRFAQTEKIVILIPRFIYHYLIQKMQIQAKPDRQARKLERLQAKQQHHLQKFTQFKSKNEYFSFQQNKKNVEGYYGGNKIDLENTNYDELHHLLKSTFSHARRRQNFFPYVDRQPDYSLRCVYSGKILSDSDGNILEKCNEEHSFPQSFQRGSKSGTGRDMHAIFSAYSSANGSRGNLPFGNCGKLIEDGKYGRIYSFEGRKFYSPILNEGAIARASLYILVCYQNCANPQYFPKESLKWMIQKASTEKVSEWELHRNDALFKLQKNRNPFIDNPSLALKIDFSKGWQQ